MAQRILKNNTGSPVPISDVGQTVPASGQLVIVPTDYGKYEGSSDVIVEIGSSVLTVNDGTFDLSITEGTRLIQGGFSRPISSGDDPTIKANVTDATGVTEYNNRLEVENIMAGRDSLGALRRVNSIVRGDGITAVPIDGVVTVTSTFGFDQQPDSFFRIINTGGEGTTWEVYIGATTNDPSTPDRDIPAYSKVFTVLAGEVGSEIQFRDRLIQELNADPVFKTNSFLKAGKASDRSIVHIFSEAISLSGEFYERPLVGDFAVTIGGSPGDGVVVVGFDNLISRSKPVSITRDFDSPHRLGLFGITGDINVTPKTLSDVFIEPASLDGLGVTMDLGVNGSGTPKEFLIPASVTTDVFIEELRIFGQGNGIQYKGWLTSNSPLTNGLKIEIKSDNIVTAFPLLYTTASIKNKFSFGQGATGFSLDIASGRDDFLGVFTFANPFIIRVAGTFTTDDFIRVTVQDNLLATQSQLEFWAKGFEKDP